MGCSILLDSASRRFRAHKIYMRAVVAVRWIQQRDQLLQGRPASPSQQAALRTIDQTLRTALVAITDQKVYTELSAKDTAAGNWTAEMPSLNTLLTFMRAS